MIRSGNESTDNATINLLIATFSTTTDVLVLVFSVCIIVANAVVSMVVVRIILILHKRRHRDVDIMINLFFICLNDVLCGLALLFYTAIQLDGTITGPLCAYTVTLCISLLITSHGNILSVCIQRLSVARNIYRTRQDQQNFRSLTLLVVNIFCGISSFILTLFRAKIYSLKSAPHSVCDFMTVFGPSAKIINMVFYSYQLTTTIAADVVCLTTIVKLWLILSKVTVSPSATSTQEGNTNSQQSSQARASIKIKQQKAIITLLILLVFFNVSILPTIGVSTLRFLGIENKVVPPRVIFLFSFVNSLINPIIIMTRMKNVRTETKLIFSVAKDKFLSCLCFL